MAVVGLVMARKEVVDGRHVGQSQESWSHFRRCRSTSQVQGDRLMTPDHTAIQVRSSREDQAGSGQSSREGLTTGCHEKALVRCQCSRLAALHGAPRTHRSRQINITHFHYFVKTFHC